MLKHAFPLLASTRWSSAALFLLLSISLLVKPSNYLAPLMVLLASACTWQLWRSTSLPREFRYFLWAACLLAACWWVDNLRSSTYWRDIQLDKPLKVLALLPCAAYLLRYPPRAIWLWLGAATGAIACGLVALYQVQVLQIPRAGGSYINPIEFGDTSIQLALISLCGTQAAPAHARRSAWLALMVAGFTLGVVGCVLSGTRGTWLAGLVALGWLGWWYLGRHSKRLLVLVMLSMALTTALVAQYAPVAQRLHVMQQEIDRYRQQGHAASSIGARLQMWQFAADLAQQRPLIGWAQKGYDDERHQQLAQGRLDPFLASFNHPHNDYLNASAKSGLPGLLALLACHLFALMYFWRAAQHTPKTWPLAQQAQRLALCAVGMMLPLLFASFGLTDTHITSSRTVVMYFFLAAFLMALIEAPGSAHTARTDSSDTLAPTDADSPPAASAHPSAAQAAPATAASRRTL